VRCSTAFSGCTNMKNMQNPESRGRVYRSWVNVLVLACGLAACGQSRPAPDANSTEAVRGARAAAQVQTANLENPEVRMAPHTGDIDEMESAAWCAHWSASTRRRFSSITNAREE